MKIERGFWIVVFGCFLATIAANAIADTGNNFSKEYPISEFDSVAVAGDIEFDIVQAKSFKVTVTSNDQSLISKIDVTKSQTTLSLTLAAQTKWWGHNFSHNAVRARIELPLVKALAISGSSHGKLHGIEDSGSLTVNMSGTSTLEGDLTAHRLVMNLSGANKVVLSGTARTMILSGSRYSNVELAALVCDDAKVDLSGDSEAKLFVQSKLSGETAGTSRLRYSGSANAIHLLTYGASSVVKE